MALFTVIAAAAAWVGGAIAAVSAWTVSLGVLGTFAIGNFLLQTAVSLGVSALAKKFAGSPDLGSAEPFAIQSSIRSGGEVPRSFPVGPTLTAGSLVWHSEWGQVGGTPNAYYTQVIALSDIPIKGLTGIFINGARATIAGIDAEDEGGKGRPLAEYHTAGRGHHAWVKFHDGTQTVADDFLVNTVGQNGPRPYGAERVGTGVAYAIVTYRLNQKIFTGLPRAKFVIDGAPLYDVSKDTSAGGAGVQRWADPSTWGGDGDSNPMVQAYNLARGITYQGKWFYGLQGLTAARLPAAHWITQIEKCNVIAPNDSDPIYRCAGEITVNSEIGAAFEAILTSCAGRMSEVGGVFKGYAGAPDASIASFTDDDILSTAPQSFTPFFGLSRSINGATASYPNPDEGYVMRQTPPVFNPDYEVEDGNRRLLTNVSLSFVPYPKQAQRLLVGELRAARRARRHTFSLPAKFRRVEPGDVVDFTSARNGYAAKLFRVDGVIDLPTCDLIIDMTEVDPTDHSNFDVSDDYEPVVPSDVVPVFPTALGVVGFDAEPATIDDGGGAPRRAAVLLIWNGTLDAITGIEFEVRLVASGDVVGAFSTLNFAAGSLLTESGLVANTAYEARARYIPDGARDVAWTSWVAVTTPNILISEPDIGASAVTWTKLGQDVKDSIDSAGDAGGSALAAQIAQAASEAGRDGAVVAQGLAVNAQNVAVDAVGSILPSDVGAVPEYWTASATSVGVYPKAQVAPALLIAGDPDFGGALEAVTVNRSFGPAYPTQFDRSRSYLVTAKVKCTDPGTGTGVRVQMGFSTFSGAGAVGHTLNAQVELDDAIFVAAGVRVFALLIKPDTLTDLGNFTAFDASIDHTSISDLADAISPHVRFNGSNATDGSAVLGSLEVRDITDALAANISAKASYTSEQAVIGYKNDVVTYAGAANQSRIDAEAARGAAEIAKSDAVDAFDDADGAKVQAIAARDIAVAIELRNFAPGLVNPGFEAGADGAPGLPGGWGGDAGTPAVLANGALACYTSAALINGSGPNASLVSFGANGTDAGAWWYVSKTFRTVPGQVWDAEYWVKLGQAVDAAACAVHGSDYVGESDSYMHWIFYKVDGTILQESTTFSAGYAFWNDNAGAVPGTADFFKHVSAVRVAPANAAFVEVRFVAADNNNSANPDKSDYSGYSGNAAVVFDDANIWTTNGSVVEALSEFGASQAEVAAGISEVAAAQALSDAGDAAAGAVFARDVSAKLLGGGLVTNPIFIDPSNGNSVVAPDDFTVTANTGATMTREPVGGKYGACVEYDTGTDLSANRPNISFDTTDNPDALAASDVDAVEVELEIEMMVGAWGTARFDVQWYGGAGGTSKSVQVFLADVIPSKNGKVQLVGFLAERPAGYVAGAVDVIRLRYYGAVVSGGGYTSTSHTGRIHRMDFKTLSQSATALIQQKAITDIAGNAEASLVFRAKAGAALGAVEVVAWDDAGGVGSGSKVSLTGDEIEFDGMGVFKEGFKSDDYVAGSDGFWMKKDGTLEINKLITGEAIVGGAVSREVILTTTTSKAVTTTADDLYGSHGVDFVAYDGSGPWPGNPVVVTITGTFYAGSSAPHLLAIYPEGKVGVGGSWTAMNMPNFYLYADHGGVTYPFSLVKQDIDFGYGFDAFTHIRWRHKVIVTGSYTGSTGTISNDIVLQVRQVNK